MRMPGLVVLERHPHVDVIACREVEIPLAHAVEQGLHPWLPEETGSRRSRRRQRARQDLLRPQPLPLLNLVARGNWPAHSEGGCLAYDARTALMDFVLDRWDREAPDTMADVLRSLPVEAAEQRVAMERAIEQLENTRPPPGRRVRMLARSDLDLASWHFSRLYDAPDESYLSTSGFQLTVVCAQPTTVAGRPHTRREVLTLHDADTPVLHHDGHRLRRWSSLHQVPTAVLHRFDAHGTAIVGGEEALMPLHDVTPTFLLEVPEPRGGGPRPGARAAPWPQPAWLVAASRIPSLEEQPELPLLTGPAAAAVLARTTAGVYLPGNAPFHASEVLGPPGSLWVGARPRLP